MSVDPPEDVPAFLREMLREFDEDGLRAISEYAPSNAAPADDVPDRVVEAFAMQDGETVEAAREYAEALAERRGTERTGPTADGPAADRATGGTGGGTAARTAAGSATTDGGGGATIDQSGGDSAYGELIETIVDHESDVLGPEKAIELARSVEGLEVDDDGVVLTIARDEVSVVGDLADVYIDQFGKVTEVALQQITGDYDLELPDNLN